MSEHSERLAARRRPLERLETEVVKRQLERPEDAGKVDELRYVLSFARLTTVRNCDAVDVELDGQLHLHAMYVQETVERRLKESLWQVVRGLPDLSERTRKMRKAVLERQNLDRDSLEEEVTTRHLAVASGGGGGAGYAYFGCYEMLERRGLTPSLMVGTSIGALTSLFRCRRARYDPAPMFVAARRLTWSSVFRVLESQSRYGLPAALRLYLRAALGSLFAKPDGSQMQLGDMQIPLYTITTGITVDALKHDLNYYEHFLDDAVRGRNLRGGVKTISLLREFLARPDALVEVVLGRAEGTSGFDALDAAGFSAAIPGVIHYDVLRSDPRMTRLLDDLYARYGITRLGEGGMVSNVPAKVAWESVVEGDLGRRNVFVLALDCFAPRRRSFAWYPLQQLVRASNVNAHRAFADLYLPLQKTLSPMNLVPALKDAINAMRWGRASLKPHMPLVSEMMRTLPVLRQQMPVPPPRTE